MLRAGVLLVLLAASTLAAPSSPSWRFDLKEQRAGLVALESIVVSDSLVLFFDNATGDQPLTINGHSAWGALWDLENDSIRALDVITDSFCGTGSLLSNGSMVSVGGNPVVVDPDDNIVALGGQQGIRIFEPCASPSGEGCTLFEDPQNIQLLAPRWYPSSVRIFDGSLMIIGGTHEAEVFYNLHWENSFEFFPRKEDTVRHSAFLDRSLPANLFPRAFALPDGTVFMVANNRSSIYDIEKNTERPLPDIPNGVRVTNPIDGSAILLPLSPPDYVPEVLVCGGSAIDDRTPVEELSSQQVATTQCSRITLTEEGIAKGWQVEHMLEPRIMPELVHLPNGQVLIINGGRTGFVGIASVKDPVGSSNADHPNFTPSLYSPEAPLGKRISNKNMPTTNIARMYHSSVTLTPAGNFLLAGSNPNFGFVKNASLKFSPEDRVETLDPPYMFMDRPQIGPLPPNLSFGSNVTIPVKLPEGLSVKDVKVSLMDLGFSSHTFHSSARLVFMDATLSSDRASLTFSTPPSGRVYPPGPATVFLTVDNVTSKGARTIMGSGKAPPVEE